MSDGQPLDDFAARLDPEVRAAVHHGAASTHEARTHALEAAYGARFASLRARAAALKAAVREDLDGHIERASQALTRAGARVHHASDAAAANRIAQDILREHGARAVVKSKSMLTEEIHLNERLEAAGIEVVETDLGEFIVQIDDDRPSHIVKPILHKNRRQIAASFEREGLGAHDEDPETIARRARSHLRAAYLRADAGITGANFLSAASGRMVLVTNEGNARFCVSAPRLHIAFVGVEKIVPTDADLAVLLELLGRSGTGQRLTVYTQFLRGPAPPEAPDGPREVHVVLVDNGRRAIAKTPFAPILGCIRCGACLNVCPVYREAGGHAYRSVYPGPVGSVLTPLLEGDRFVDLPKACSTCGACGEVCPVEIPLPDLLLRARDRGHRRAPELADRGAPDFSTFVTAAEHPALWRTALAAGHASSALPQAILRLAPPARAWTEARALPPWQGGRFRRWLRGRAAPRPTDPRFEILRATDDTDTGRPPPRAEAALDGDLWPADLPDGPTWATFRAQLGAVHGRCLDGATGLRAALEALGARQGYVPAALADHPDLQDELQGLGLSDTFDVDRHGADAPTFAVTTARGAIAETGTLVLADPDGPRLASLAPWVHVALVEADALWPDLPAALAALDETGGAYTVWVTGPSKTADVEGILIEGAHGPGALVVCIGRWST